MNRPIFRRTVWTALVFFFITTLFLPGEENFRLEDVLSYSFPSHFTVFPGEDLAAWVFNTEGKRNIWIARGPEYKAKQITDYGKDDGQELGDLAFNVDGTVILYVRGGAANRSGEHPNPTSDPGGAEQAVWAVGLETGNQWKVGNGYRPLCSPADNRVVFQARGGIYLSGIEEGAKPRPLFEARGGNAASAWSPDGKKLAFVSRREDHSFIGVYDFERNTIIWVDPSVDMDGYPVWSPCGEYIAFIRFTGGPGSSFRGGRFFKIMTASLETKKSETVWECPNATGGFAQYYPAQTLRWAQGGYLVFTSEHEKWMHLYSLSLKDKKLISLTPGDYEVEDSFLSFDGKELLFNANKEDIDRRHIWSVPVSGGTAVCLTPGNGIEWSPARTAESKDLLFLCSTARQPAAPACQKQGEKNIRLMAPGQIPDRFPSDKLVTPEQVVIKTPDGYDVHCQLFVPRNKNPKEKHPAVIFMHGGPIRQMLLGWHMRGYYHNAYAMNQYLAGKGYVVLSVNYRSGIGYGYGFRNAPNQGPRGASEYQDIIQAGLYLQRRPDVDPGKVGLWGGSYGGYLTAMGLARDSDLFAAGVDLHGVHDWSLRGRRRNGGGWDIQGEDIMSMAYQSSPVADIAFWSSPVLFVHGDDDRNVDFIQTTDLVHRLRRLGIAHVETLIIPDEVHGFLRHHNWLKVYKAAADFFDRFL